MDPLNHVNHPMYLDWVDEALRAALQRRGVDPQGLLPVVEDLRWRSAVLAGETVQVELSRRGDPGPAGAWFDATLRAGDQRVVAQGSVLRSHLDGGAVFS
jgi:acyl-CoA thioesterase FadM